MKNLSVRAPIAKRFGKRPMSWFGVATRSQADSEVVIGNALPTQMQNTRFWSIGYLIYTIVKGIDCNTLILRKMLSEKFLHLYEIMRLRGYRLNTLMVGSVASGID